MRGVGGSDGAGDDAGEKTRAGGSDAAGGITSTC